MAVNNFPRTYFFAAMTTDPIAPNEAGGVDGSSDLPGAAILIEKILAAATGTANAGGLFAQNFSRDFADFAFGALIT